MPGREFPFKTRYSNSLDGLLLLNLSHLYQEKMNFKIHVQNQLHLTRYSHMTWFIPFHGWSTFGRRSQGTTSNFGFWSSRSVILIDPDLEVTHRLASFSGRKLMIIIIFNLKAWWSVVVIAQSYRQLQTKAMKSRYLPHSNSQAENKFKSRIGTTTSPQAVIPSYLEIWSEKK